MADPADIDEADASESGDLDVHGEALQQFGEICAAQQEERALALSDRRFVSIAGAQWEGDWEAQFANSVMVEVNKTAAGVEKIIADYRQNRVTVNFRGVGKGTDEDTADTLDGMFRADVYASKGQQAFDNAFEEGVQGGMGAWRLCNDYEDEFDPDNESQRIRFEAIVDADQCVFWDPNAKLYDKSDADYCFVVTALSRGAYKKKYDDDPASWPEQIQKAHYDWYTPAIVRVAEYYRVELKTGMRGIFKHRATGEQLREWMADLSADDLAAMQTEGWQLLRQRKTKRRIIRKWTLSAGKVLKGPQTIAGECIPVVPYYGKRWWIDNMERSRGHVRLAKDPQRIYNAQISKLTETASLAPLERPILTPEQIAGHEQSWANANLVRAPYALINPTVDPVTGQAVNQGPIGSITPPQLSPVLAALVQITANDIAELTSADDGADQTMSNVSAEAMDIAATRTDAKSGIYMDNFKQSMQRCGEIYQSMARDVYFEEGREVETLSDDGEHGTATLAEPYTDDQGRFSIRNDLSRGKYKVISDVTEATATRRDKTVKTLLNGSQIVAVSDPELANAMITTAMLNMDGDGIGDLQAWMRQRALQSGLVKPTKEEQDQLDQAQQQQQPDPQAQALQAQAEALAASAQKEAALAEKAVADTKLSGAKTVLTLAQAHAAGQDAHHSGAERKVGVLERVKNMFAPRKTTGQET